MPFLRRTIVAIIHPFRAFRPPAERVADVASPPYDVVSTEEARALAADNPLSFLHVSRPEIDLPEGTDIYSDAVYRKAAENFEKLIKECPLEEEKTESLYLYRLIMGDHEPTRPEKEDDPTRHILTLNSQTGPVFLTYRADDAIDTMVMETTVTEAL